jgi:hypothetical protein
MNLVENAYLFAPKYELTNIGEKEPVLERLQLVRKDMDVNDHESLSKITLRHKLK